MSWTLSRSLLDSFQKNSATHTEPVNHPCRTQEEGCTAKELNGAWTACVNSRCLQVLAEEYLEDVFSGGKPSAPLNSTPSHGMSWSLGKTMAPSKRSRSGMTYQPSTDAHGEDVLTWCLEASLVRTYPSPVAALESPANEADSGSTWRELSMKYDPNTSSWKTHQCLSSEDLPLSSVTLPRWGMMRAGVCWERIMSERRIKEIASGFWPTPTVHGNHNRSGLSAKSGDGLATSVNSWPTPRASPNENRQSKLTPSQNQGRHGMSLGAAVNNWPTPVATEGKDCGSEWKNLAPHDNGGRIQRRIATLGGIETQQTKRALLNAAWVEWLMGWPIGWTDCAVSAMGKSQQWRDSHGLSCRMEVGDG